MSNYDEFARQQAEQAAREQAEREARQRALAERIQYPNGSAASQYETGYSWDVQKIYETDRNK